MPKFSLLNEVQEIYDKYGMSKSMDAEDKEGIPCFFLLRKFLNENDFLVIFNMGKCPYGCTFCNLNESGMNNGAIPLEAQRQFLYACKKVKHALSIVERLTLSNNNSVLNRDVFPQEDLLSIINAATYFRSLKTIVLETNMLFLSEEVLFEIKKQSKNRKIDILAGIETVNDEVREKILKKPEGMDEVLAGLDILSKTKCSLTAYILYKPDYRMSDMDAFEDAWYTAEYLREETAKRKVPLSIRINPMYQTKGSVWTRQAMQQKGYRPPKLSDVLRLGEKLREQGIRVYIGLSTEKGSIFEGTYRTREDFSKELLKRAISFNHMVG